MGFSLRSLLPGNLGTVDSEDLVVDDRFSWSADQDFEGDVNVTGTLTATGALAASSTVLSSGGAIGYTTGAGGTVTQATDKSTGVTLSELSGQITMNAEALAAAAEASFTVTNTTVAATDVVIVNHGSGGTAGAYLVGVSAVGAGSFEITVSNVSAGSLSEAIVINFAVIKGASS